MKIKKQLQQRGTAIVLVISIMATLMVIVGVAAEYTTTISRNVSRSNTLGNAIAIADGCIDHNFAHWRKISKTPGDPTPSSEDLEAIPLPTGGASGTQFPDIKNFSATQSNYSTTSTATVQQCKVIAVDPQYKKMSDEAAAPLKQLGQSAESVIYNYLATAYVSLPAMRGNVVAKVQRVFQKEQLSPWNWAIFYNDPLEIHPGPEFHVTGWVHTNSDLYTGHDTLHFEDKVTYAGDWTIGYKAGDGQHPSPPAPSSPHYPANLPPALDSTGHEPFDVEASVFNATDANPNNDSYHELIEPPSSSATDPLAGKRYYDQASVIIEIDGSNGVTFRNSSGNVINSSSGGNDKKLYDMFKDAVTTNENIQDNREQSTVRLATLDMSKLVDWDWSKYSFTSGFPYKTNKFNGVVYIHDTSAAANGVGAKRGIRIKNGAYIPEGGITVASANPVYIQGDFNTGASPPSNTGTTTDPEGTVPGAPWQEYNRKACSVIADAVNVLSNSWVDANSTAGVGSRVASNTTVNTAIVSGIVPSGISNNNYSGGAENFPRFLETWASKTLTYYGSMVQLYKSQQAIGTWGKSNVYGAPLRQWFFDTNFRKDTPPGSLMVYTYTKGRWALAP